MENTSNPIEDIINTFKFIYQKVEALNSLLNKPEVNDRIVKFFDYLKDLPENTKIFIGDLAYRGWFFTDEMTLNEISSFFNLTTSQNSINELQIDEYMGKLVEKYIPHIKKNLYERFPDRKDVLDSAFNAHENKQYNLSIPVFLAQADGIGSDLLNGVSPFSRKKSKVGVFRIKEEIDRLSTQVDTTLIDPLGLPIATTSGSSSSERIAHPHLYNRHEVIHGLSTDYGTKTNSLKAISLLGHLATVFYDVVEEHKEISFP